MNDGTGNYKVVIESHLDVDKIVDAIKRFQRSLGKAEDLQRQLDAEPARMRQFYRRKATARKALERRQWAKANTRP